MRLIHLKPPPFFMGPIVLISFFVFTPSWSAVPQNHILAIAPFSNEEIVRVKKEITDSYQKKGVMLTKVSLEKILDYSLAGSAHFLKPQNDNDFRSTPQNISSQFECAANKGLDGAIRWNCARSLNVPERNH